MRFRFWPKADSGYQPNSDFPQQLSPVIGLEKGVRFIFRFPLDATILVLNFLATQK